MRALVTGAAGFIGSTLCERLLRNGHEVLGVDCFLNNYSRQQKEKNLTRSLEHKSFRLLEVDLVLSPLESVVEDVSIVFHQAGQPGVRSSWGRGFHSYVDNNVLGTQRLLEAARQVGHIEAFIAASSSSVYGAAEVLPTKEEDLPCPVSPYGVTKLASENLCSLYGTEFGMPTVSLRYFTVYGPRQRPDMAFNRIIAANLKGESFEVLGDGLQLRDFTFVDEVVRANLDCAELVGAKINFGDVLNVGGNRSTSLLTANTIVEQITGKKTNLVFASRPHGDPAATGASPEKMRSLLGWQPSTPLANGLEAQVAWQISQDSGYEMG